MSVRGYWRGWGDCGLFGYCFMVLIYGGVLEQIWCDFACINMGRFGC